MADFESSQDILTVKLDSVGNIIWNRTINWTGDGMDQGYDIVLDSANNVYISGDVDIGSDYDMLIAKYDNNGTLIWNISINGPGNDWDAGNAIAIDEFDNIYVGGDTQIGTNSDVWTLKYDSDGNQIWNRTYNAPENYSDIGYEIIVDNANNVYVTGYTQNASKEDVLILKYDSAGNLIWNRTYDAPELLDDYGYAMVADNANNIYVSGKTTFNMDYKTIILKYDSTGNQIWNKTLNLSTNNSAYGIALDSANNVYLSGDIDIGPNYDIYVMKFDNDGNYIWTKTYNGPNNLSDWNYDIAIDDLDNIYVTGFTENGLNDDLIVIKYYYPESPFTINKSIVADTTPPKISNVKNSSITSSTAIIEWITDENSNSSLNYGVTTSMGSFSGIDDSVINHSIALTSLSGSTLYYYNVTSCDISSNCNTSENYNFTTTPVPCIENITNTSWTAWNDILCLVDDTTNQTRNKTEYDQNNCGSFTNKTYIEYRTTESCDYCTPSWGCDGYGICQLNNESLCNSAADSNNCYAVTGLGSDQYAGDYSEFSVQACVYDIVNISINLTTGWNLISIPLALDNNTLPLPLLSINGSYESMFSYDSSDDGDEWKLFDPNVTQFNTLSDLNPDSGSWIKMTEDRVLEIEGTVPENVSFNLIEGWNMIGYPSNEFLPAEEVFQNLSDYDAVYAYDAENFKWLNYIPGWGSDNTLTTIKPGMGMWLKSYVNQTAFFIDGGYGS